MMTIHAASLLEIEDWSFTGREEVEPAGVITSSENPDARELIWLAGRIGCVRDC